MIGREVLSEIAAQTSDRDLSGLFLHSNTVGGGLGSRRKEETASPELEWWRNSGNPDGKPVRTSAPETDLNMGRKKITGDNCTEMINLENGQSGTKSLAIFCDLCIKEVGKGQMPGTHFNIEGWASLVANFHAETGNNYDKSQLKNKWDLLKKEWKLWKDLIGKETGLGWNLTKNIVDASDEWWRNKIQINPQYVKLRVRGINPDMEAKLDMMFNGAVATGKYAWAPSSDLPPPQNEKAPKDNVISLDDNLDYEEFDLNKSTVS
ncbi:hypothetical protein ACLB2K_056804 [Fragaria x ananassa]